MSRWLRQLLRLEPGDAGRLLLFGLLGALLQGGLAIGISTADSLFLTRVGVTRLPVIYLLTPVIMLAYIPVYSLLLSRLGINRVFRLTLGLLTAGGILFGVLFLVWGGGAAPAALYYLAKLYATLWWIALYTLYWNFVDGYFDILDAKRLYALLSAACAAGAGLGGLLVNALSRYLEVPQLFFAWAMFAVLTIPVFVLILRRGRSLDEEDGAGDAAPAGLLQELRQTGGLFRHSRYAGLLTGVLFLTLVVTAVCEYQYMGVFSAHHTEKQLAALFGGLYAGVSVFNVVVNLFLFNRLVARIGVRNTALLQPAVYLLVFLGFLLDDSGAAALLGFLAYQGLLVTVDYNNVNFLINALPAAAKKQLRTFIEGIAEPAATATGGLFLLLWAGSLGPDRLALTGLLLAVAALALVAWLRAEYVRAMIANLKRGWLDFARPLAAVVRDRPPAETAWLEATARSGPPEAALLAIRLLWLSDRYRAADCLLAFLTPPEEARCRAAQPLLALMLAEGDHEMMRRVLAWLNRHHEPLGPTLLEELGQRGLVATQELQSGLHTRAPEVRAAAAATLSHSWRVGDSVNALQTLDRLLRGSPAERRAAMRGLGRCGQPRYAHFLVPQLRLADAEDRREALDAMRRLATRESTRLLPALLEVVRSGLPRERSLALDALGRIGDPDCIAPLLDASGGFAPRELREAENVLLGIGQRGVPAIVSCLQDPSHPYAGRGLAARALSRVSFAQFESVYPGLIGSEIDRAYRFHARHALLAAPGAATPGREVLARFYGDMPATVIDFILELLGLGGRLPDFESVTASLRSRNPKDRANAIETVEQACSRATFVRLVPLLEGRFGAAAAPGEDQVIGDACASRFVIEAAAGLQILLERSPPAARAAMRERIRDPELPPALRAYLLALLEQLITGAPPTEPNLVEKVHALGRAAFCRGLRIEELVLLAATAQAVAVADGPVAPPGGGAARFGLVLAGEAVVGGVTARPGDLFNEASLWRSGPGPAATGRGLRALLFEVPLVLELAGCVPRLALALLDWKLERRHAA